MQNVSNNPFTRRICFRSKQGLSKNNCYAILHAVQLARDFRKQPHGLALLIFQDSVNFYLQKSGFRLLFHQKFKNQLSEKHFIQMIFGLCLSSPFPYTNCTVPFLLRNQTSVIKQQQSKFTACRFKVIIKSQFDSYSSFQQKCKSNKH